MKITDEKLSTFLPSHARLPVLINKGGKLLRMETQKSTSFFASKNADSKVSSFKKKPEREVSWITET